MGEIIDIDGYTAATISCSLCQTVKAHTLFTRHQFAYQRCQQCSLVRVSPQLTQDTISNIYEKGYKNKSHAAPVLVKQEQIPQRQHDILKALIQICGNMGYLLDVGCFEGHFLWSARELGWQVTGTEISETAVNFARETWQLDVRLGALEEIRFENDQFDAVVLRDVIEHLPDPKHTLQEINRILRPGGALYVWTPNFDSLTRLLVGQRWGAVIFPWHLYYFTPSTLLQMSRTVGFTPIEMTTRNLLLDFRDRYTALKKGEILAVKRPLIKRFNRLLDKLSRPLFKYGDRHNRYWGAQIEMFACKDEI